MVFLPMPAWVPSPSAQVLEHCDSLRPDRLTCHNRPSACPREVTYSRPLCAAASVRVAWSSVCCMVSVVCRQKVRRSAGDMTGSLLGGLGPWGVVERLWCFCDDLGSKAHIHILCVGDTMLDVTSRATRRIEPCQALWLQHGRTIPHLEGLIALQGSRQR